MLIKIEDLVLVGFNKQVIALDRYSGNKVWEWKASNGAGFPAILLDGDRVIVSVQGYTYCLEPISGSEVWMNELKGHGTGTANLVSVRGSSSQSSAAEVIAVQQAAAVATSTGVTT
ncbi:MAG: PQQ-binding-like beta-propeller repeat protein [Phycisphaerae bacterium]|jgi:outer membrane protein assembly factor BamB|nr:PQQ-binding-like beta-propeller repeat protein [Phycisphaerae bacterium]